MKALAAVTWPVAVALTTLGCATVSSGAGENELASMHFTHRVQPGWHLRSLSLAPAGEPGQQGCRPEQRPLRLEMQYAREDGSGATPVTSIRCATRHSYLPVAVHQTSDGAFAVGARLPRDPAAAAPVTGGGGPAVSEPTLIPARAVREVPAQIPPALQVSERGHKYHVSVCTNVQGGVVSLRLVSDHHNPEVVARILDALMQWQYQPAQLNGHAVPSCPWAHVVF